MLRFDNVLLEQGAFRLRADFSISEGDHVALIGPSGAGKSTLLAAVAGFLEPTEGSISWQGVDLGPLGPGDRPMNILFQDNNLFPHLTVSQNVGLGLRPDLKLSKAEIQKVNAALAQVGLDGKTERKPASLSGGQMARVAIARAVLRSRPLMLLDEPFSALGPALKREMLELVSRVAKDTGSTLLMITHEPEDARRIASKTIVIAGGKASAPVDTEEALSNPPKALAAYLGQ
ncbi:thiamine ABC transporter ATP-binding protein [Falsihalocynthiibacter sp. SS001]|uniref:thiamine ABC transporter ATP-binding protein n=1 Tax=Falsihalocynthiibacter sp. SS001 TaxID=3349698 RepID=UPI0036D3200C